VTFYVDSSALLKLCVNEFDSPDAQHFIDSDPRLVTLRITLVDIRRNLARVLEGSALVRA
jgi:hypothetical protein